MSEQDNGGPARHALLRIASACCISEDPYTMWTINGISGNRRALYWRARSVVAYDRAIRSVDDDMLKARQAQESGHA